MSNINTLVIQKQKELQALQAVKLLSDSLLDQLKSVKGALETIGDGAEAVALVLGNWDMIIKAVSLASMGLGNYQEEDFQAIFQDSALLNPEDQEKMLPLPELLVRLRVEEKTLQEQEQVVHEGQVPEDEAFESDTYEYQSGHVSKGYSE